MGAIQDKKRRKKSTVEVQAYWAGEAGGGAANKMIHLQQEQYTKPEQYTGNRQLYDSPSAKVAAKKQIFNGGKPVKDPYTSKRLQLRKQDAKVQYGSEWTKHLAETDHTVPIEQVHKQYKDNPFITNDDIREVANSPENIQVTSRKFNNAKRSRTNKELIDDKQYCQDKDISVTPKGKNQALENGQKAQEAIESEMRSRMVKNAVKTFHEGGMNTACAAAEMTAAWSAGSNLLAVIKGEKTGAEAIEDFTIETGKSAAGGYLVGGSLSVVARSLSSNKSPMVKSLLQNNVPGQVVTAIIQTGDILLDYVQGKINLAECCQSLGERGIGITIAGYGATMGQAIIPIPIVGAMVGSMVASAVYGDMYSQVQSLFAEARLAQQEYERVRAMEEAAIQHLQVEQAAFEAITQKLFAERGDSFETGLEMIRSAVTNNQPNTMFEGMNEILSTLGRSLPYSSAEELGDLIDDDNFTLEL